MKGRIEVTAKDDVRDVVGEKTKKRIKEEFGIDLSRVRFADVYNFGTEFDDEELEEIAGSVFADSVSQRYSVKEPLFKSEWRIEIGFLPGVTDNIGKTAMTAVKEKTEKDVEIYYSRLYALSGGLGNDACKKIASLLYNSLVEKAIIHSPGAEPAAYTPKVVIKHEPDAERISLHMSVARFQQLAKDRLLALSVDEFKAIKKYFKESRVIQARKKVGLDTKITDVELEAIAQTWSEHCKHKIFNAQISYKENGEGHAINSLFKTFIKSATEQTKKPYVVSVFKDNGGIIKFNHDYDIAVKVETHNAPSALDPYGGALTGVLGVQRDVIGTGIGANPIANLDVLCFGYPDEKDIPRGVLHPKVIYEGVVKGIEDGGNKMGIPTVNGSIVFDRNYTCRPLVYCGTVGVMPSHIGDRKTKDKKIEPGYLAVMVGGRIGKDGIHGATFSSQQIDESVPQSVVQIGDPITQKKMLDFIIEARDNRLYEAITDNGAGGLSSSVGELAQLSGGCEIYLDKCPLKYPGLDPWEILVSESQERMTLAVPEENIEKLQELAGRHDVEMTVVGKFTDSGKFHVFYGDKSVAYLDMKFLHEGLPQMKLKASWKKLLFPEPKIDDYNAANILKKLLSSPNITTKESVIRRYDHEVKGMSVIKPLMLGPCDGAVMKAVYESEEGIVISHGICPKYVQDGYAMASLAFDEAVRNSIAVGGRFGYLACLDNFSWPDPIQSKKTPDGEYKLGQLVRSCIGLYDCATSYGVPVISGKDSMKNDYYDGENKYSIPPTLLVTIVGKIDDIKKAVSSSFKKPGDIVYVLGTTREEMGGSDFYRLFGGVGNNPPQVRSDENIPLYRKLSAAMEEGVVASAHDVSDGGLAVCFAECAVGSGLGASLDLARIEAKTQNEKALLFSESAGRFVVSINPENVEKFEFIMRGLPAAKAGRVRGDRRLIIQREEKIIINEEVERLREAFNKGTGV
jgi:phosphoribosylformylglycinamidine synthase II